MADKLNEAGKTDSAKAPAIDIACLPYVDNQGI
jgi:hypothetical protein